jgi:YVTN family beta-propeller protein
MPALNIGKPSFQKLRLSCTRRALIFPVIVLLFVLPSSMMAAFSLSPNAVYASTYVVTNVPVGSHPSQLAYDSSDKYVHIADCGGGVSIISSSANRIVATISGGGGIGDACGQVVYAPSSKEVYVANPGTNSVFVLKGVRLIKTINVGTQPENLVYDLSNKFVYVGNWASNSVYVISTSTNAVYGTNQHWLLSFQYLV